MKWSFLKTRYVTYTVFLAITGAFLFNFLLSQQSRIMHKYFVETPSAYNTERAEKLTSSIYKSFKEEVTEPSFENIREFVKKYNDLPFLSVNFVYEDESGQMKSVLEDTNEVNLLNAEYVYPIKYQNREIGTLLVADIAKEYQKGLDEYKNILTTTRIFFAVLLLLLLSILFFHEYSSKIEEEKIRAEYRAVHDGLTGLYTHQFFKDYLVKEIDRSQRYKRPLSLIMCDVDFFKKFNDTYGHLAGDKVLKKISWIIATNVRASDTVARYGGEEFAVLLVETGIEEAKGVVTRMKKLTDEALDVASRIKDKVEHETVSLDQKEVHVTLSMGLASYDGSGDYKPEYLIGAADNALYESKKNGRNTITLYDSQTKEFKKIG